MMPQASVRYDPTYTDEVVTANNVQENISEDDNTPIDDTGDDISFFDEAQHSVKQSDHSDISDETAYLRKLLGDEVVDNNVEFEVYQGDNIWGYVHGLNLILRSTEKGTTVKGIATHEAVHFTLRNMMTETSRLDILSDTKKHIERQGKYKSKDISDKYAEEWLAEAARGKNKVKSNYTGLKGKLKQFVDWISDLFFNVEVFGNEAFQYLNDLHNGKFRDGDIMTQNYGNETVYLTEETSIEESESLFEETNNEELIRWFGEGKFYAKIKRAVSDAMIKTSIFSGKITNDLGKQQLRQLSETTDIIQRIYGSKLDGVNTDQFNSFKSFTDAYNRLGREGLPQYYYWLLSQPNMLNLVIEDIIQRHDKSEEGVNKAQKTFNDKNSISIEQYSSQQMKLFLKTIPKAKPVTKGIGGVDVEYVSDENEPFLNYSKLNQILHDFMLQADRNASIEDIMHEMYDFVANNITGGEVSTQDAETVQYLASFLKRMGFLDTPKDSVKQSRRQGKTYRKYSSYSFIYDLNEIAEYENIDLRDSSDPIRNKLLEIARHHGAMLTSIFQHYNNQQTIKFVSITKKGENSKTEYGRNVRLSSSQNENYNQLRQSIQKNLYGEDSETLKDSFLQQLNEKDDKGNVTSYYNIDKSTGDVSVQDPKSRNKRMVVLKFDKKTNSYSFVEDVDQNIIRKLASFVGMNLSRAQVGYIYEGKQKAGFANRSNFDHKRFANMLGHMFQAAYLSKQEKKISFDSGDILSRSLSEYLHNQMKLLDTDGVKINDFIDDLKDMGFKLGEVNAMLTNLFTKNAKGDKRYTITQANEVSKMIDGNKRRPSELLQRKYLQIARKIAETNSQGHYFITPKGKQLDPFLQDMFSFMDYEVMLMMTDGFTSKDYKNLDAAEILKAEMDIFFESALKGYKYNKVRMGLNSWGESHSKPFVEVAFDGLFHTSTNSKGHKEISFSHKKAREAFTIYFDKMMHESWTSLNKMKKLILDTQNQQQAKDTKRTSDYNQMEKYLKDIENAINRKGLSYTPSLKKANDLMYEYLNKIYINSKNEADLLQYLSRSGLIQGIDFRYGKDEDGKKSLRTTVGFHDDIINTNNMERLYEAKTDKQVREFFDRIFKNRASDLVSKANEMGMGLPQILDGETNYQRVFNEDKSINDMMMTYLTASYMVGESFDTLFAGHHKQEKDHTSFFKRMKKNDSSGYKVLTVDPDNPVGFGLPKYSNTLRILDTTGQFKELLQVFSNLNTEYVATDGAFIELGIHARLRANSVGDMLSIVDMHDKTSKTIDTGIDEDNGLGVMNKNAGFVPSQDMMAFYPKFDQLMKLMLTGGKSIPGVDQNILYDRYRDSLREGKTFDEAMDDVYREIIVARYVGAGENTDNIDLSDLMISRIEHLSGIKLPHGDQNYMNFDQVMEKYESGNFSDVIKSRTDNRNTRVILSHNMDLRKTDVTMLSQAFSALAMDMSKAGYGHEAQEAVRQITRDAFSKIDEKYSDNFEKEYRNDAVKGMRSYKDASSLMAKVASENTSIHIPTFIGKTLPSFMKNYKKAINFKTNGWKLVQAPAFMMRQYKLQDDMGNTYYGSYQEAQEYAIMNGIDINQLEEKGIESYRFKKVNGKWQISKPEDVVMRLPNMEALGIDPNDRVSLNELLTLQLNGKSINVRQFVKNKSKDYYMDMTDGIEALIELLTDARLDALSEDGKQIDMSTFLGNNYFTKAIRNLYKNETDKEKYVENVQNMITDPEEIANWFEKLLKSTLVTTTRIPTNNWAANGVGEIVGLSYDSGSVIYRSAERTVLDDSDFDIDQLTALFQNFTSLEDTNMQTENNLKNRIQDNFHKSLMDPDNIALTTMQMDLDNFKKLVAKVRGKRKYYFNHPATNAEITHAALAGERMVGYVANGLNVFHRIMSMDPNKRAELIKMDNISSADKSVFIDRFRVFSELLQTALDNQNDPVIQFFGLNPVTSNIITAMAIEGKTTEEIYKMLQNEEVSKLINQATRSRRIMNKTADISDYVEAALAKYERYMSEEGEKTFIENWINNFKERQQYFLDTYYSLSEDVELAKETGIKENITQAYKALNYFVKNNEELSKEYTEADINEMAENEYDKLYDKKDTLVEFNNYIKKGEFIGRLSTFSLHQGYDPKQADIYMKNMMYIDFTGEKITDYNNRDAKKVQTIEEKFKDKEGYNLHKRGDERIRSYRDAHTKMSLINTSINRVGIQGVINRNNMSEAPANFTFVTNGQHGIDSLIGFTPEYNGRQTKVKHVIPEKIFDNKGKRIKGKEFAESLQNEAENISAEATNMRAKEVMESNVKNSNGVVVFTNGNQLTWEGKEMKRLANKYGVPINYIDINWELDQIREKFGESLVETHKATEDRLRLAGKKPIGLKDINVVVTGANSNTLMYESETPFETALRREMEIREIGNIKDILHQIPSLDLYMNGYVKANQMLSKNLLPFTKMVQDIAHESFLKRIGQDRFRSKKQYYAFMDAFNAAILNEHYQENRVKIDLSNLSDYITRDLETLKISIEGVRDLDLGNYWDANIFANQFPEIGDALKFNPEFKHNYFIQSLSIQNGKLVVKGAMSMNDGEINRVMMDAMEIKKAHPELYDAFKNYTFIANGISASGNSLITFLDESVYKEISVQYDRMMTYAQTYEADPNRTLFDIRVPLIDKINNTDFPSLVIAYNEDAALYHNREMQEAGYNPDIVKKTFYQRDHMGDILFQYMAPHKLNEKTGQYEKMNSKLSKKVKILPLGKYENGLTPHEVVRPENAEQMLHFENGSTVTIKKSKHGYQTTNGYFLNRPANIQVAGTKIKVSLKESKRQDSRYVSSEHQSARSFQKTAASNFISRLANINGIQDNVTIVTNKTSMHPETLSYIENGVIYFNVENMRNDTLVHEFGHILMDVGLKANENTGIYKAANRLYDFAKKALDNQEPIAMKVMNKYPELSGVDLIKEIAVTTLGFRAADGTAALINGLGQQETGRLINETAKFESTFSDEMSLAQPLTGFSLDNITMSSSMDDIINGLISDLMTGKFGNYPEVRNYLSEVRGLNMENSLTELDATRKSNDLSDVTEQVEELFDSNPELANQVYEALGFQGNINLGSNLKNTGKTEKELIEYLKEKYPEIKLDISNNPIWEKNSDIVKNQEEYNKEVNYRLKAVEILSSDKAKQVFDKGNKNNWNLDKILTELAIPKEQKQLLLDLGIKDREQLAVELASKYAFTVEMNVVFEKVYGIEQENIPYLINYTRNDVKYKNNSDWSYKEVQINTPLIEPSIKGHTEPFDNANGIGWIRVCTNEKTGEVEIQEIQSDLFQKGRDKEQLTKLSKEIDIHAEKENRLYVTKDYFYSKGNVIQDQNDFFGSKLILIDENNNEIGAANRMMGSKGKYWLYDSDKLLEKDKIQNQFLQLLNKDNNWVAFFIKSTVQHFAKQGYTTIKFPKGETAAKIQGHETFADKIRKIDKEIEDHDLWVKKYKQGLYTLEGEINDLKLLPIKDRERQGLLDKKQKLKSQNLVETKPIEAFYEINVGNILNKQYGKGNIKITTDEHGSQWSKLEVDPTRDLANILLQKDEANRIIGQANIKAMTVLVDAVNKKGDTIPHEYAHHYIAWFRNTPIVKEGIKRFKSEEALVQAIGEQVVKQKGEAYNWWKKFTNWILNLMSDKQLLQVLTDSFLNRQNLNDFTYNEVNSEQKQQAQRAYAQYINDESNSKKHLNDLSPELQKLIEPKKTEYDREISLVDLFETKGFDQKVLKKELEPHIMPVLKNHLTNMINEVLMESGDIGLISFISQVKESESFADLPNNISYKAKGFMQEKNINIDEIFVKNVLLTNLDKLPLDVLFKNDIYKKDGKYYAKTKSFKSSGLSTGNYNKKVSSWHRLKSYPRGQYDATIKATFKPNQVGLGKYHQTDMLDPLSNNEKTMYAPEFISDQDVEIDLESTVKFNKDLQLDQNTLDPFIDRNKYMSDVDNPGITNDYFGDKRLFEEAEQYFNNNVGMQNMDTSNMNFDSFKKYLANKNIQASKNLSNYEIGLLETDAFKSIIDNDTPVIPSIENGIRILNIGDNEIPTQYFSNIAGMKNKYTYIKGTFDNIIDQVIQNEVENGNVIIYC
jgi:hypothetical protein